MHTTWNIIKAMLAATLLLGSAACTPAHTAPTMLDYAYVPPAKAVSAATNYGIDDF